ncbi:hypothetical protein LTR85_010018 [Meristemomyces frigidus]|nr:hypothetical protein LTR85_010018 [Meristemomyces frigidus]
MSSQNGESPGLKANKAAVADLLERNKKYSADWKAPPPLKDGIIKAVNAGRRTTLVNCGMTHFTGAEFQQKTEQKHPDLATPSMQFGEVTDPSKTILEDMRHLKSFKSFEDNGTEVRGFVLDLKSGLMAEAKL